jgi:hypothetical protein
LASGRPYYAEPGLIVLPEVTTEAIRQAVSGLLRDGYFQHSIRRSGTLRKVATT